jgi:ABC-type transport system involved in cytochrome c biogenesis permease subunit
MLLELRLLRLAASACAGAGLLYLLGLFVRPRGVRRTGTIVLFIGWLFCSLALGLRMVEARRLPVYSPYDVLLWFVWSLLVVYLVAEERTRVTLPGLLVAGVGLGITAAGLPRLDHAIVSVLPQQDSVWFTLHALALYFAYALLAVAVAIELSSPFYGPLIRRQAQEVVERQERYLEFRGYAYRLVLLAFPFLSFALISNALWRSAIRGHYWAWAQEETWALITWLLFAGYLHLRTQLRTARTLTAVVSLLGAGAIALTFVGVGWLIRLLGLKA